MIFQRQAERRSLQASGQLRFERMIQPHLDAAYNLARWITRNEQDAEDVVQEASLRAFRFLDGFHGGDGRAWFLTIVRNTCYTWLRQHRAPERNSSSLDDERQAELPAGDETNPERLLLQQLDTMAVKRAVEELPAEFREVIVLREMEGLSYKEIAEVTGVPVGTVMSRLARARKRLHQCLVACAEKEGRVNGGL